MLSGVAASLVLALLLAGAAQASNATIKQTIRAAGPTITSDEGAILSNLGQFVRSHDPAPVRAAIAHEISDLTALRGRVAAQSSSSQSGKRGKSAFTRGMSLIIKSYRQLDALLGRSNTSTQAARSEVNKALRNVKKGRAQIKLAAQLFG